MAVSRERTTIEERTVTARKALFNILGCFFVGLGIAGIILPLVPATPFLLLASACFLRGSDRLHDWLMGHRLMGPYLRNFKEHRAMPLQAKVGTVALLWVSIGFSIASIDRIAVRIALVVVAIGTTTYILFRLGTLPKSAPSSLTDDRRDDAAGTGLVPVLAEIDPLPGAEQ
jgi:uncharacterized membrane protein YbaN (DUF454 family)